MQEGIERAVVLTCFFETSSHASERGSNKAMHAHGQAKKSHTNLLGRNVVATVGRGKDRLDANAARIVVLFADPVNGATSVGDGKQVLHVGRRQLFIE